MLQFGQLKINWYGFMYFMAFITVYLIVSHRVKKEKFLISQYEIDELFFFIVVGLLLGGRLGYILLYNFKYYFAHPFEAFFPFSEIGGKIVFTGYYGMSYHGGLAGVALSFYIFSRRYKKNFWELIRLFAPVVPLGYMFGRIGNFINGELYGRPTTFFWGMYFPRDDLHLLRHPSQLYEAFLEGPLLFFILYFLFRRLDGRFIFAAYMIGYGMARFVAEFFREPDSQLGYVFLSLSMGQVLSIIMMLLGTITIVVFSMRK